MRARIPLFLILALLFLSAGCITSLRVSTEVYEGPVPPDPLPVNAARVGALTETALQNYGTSAVTTASDTYAAVIDRLAERYPLFIDRSKIGAFRESFRIAATEAMTPAMSSAATARSLAQQLRSISCVMPNTSGCDTTVPSDAILEQWATTLRAKLQETARLGRIAIQDINDAEAEQVRRLLESNFGQAARVQANPEITKKNDAELARITGMSVASDEQRRLAAAVAIGQARDITRDLLAADDAALVSLLVTQLDVGAAATQIVPLEDPAVRMILTQTETNPKVWKKYVNDVYSFNQFGNAEIAFRMDGLGDSHIKGVMFDSSQAMRTGFSVLAKTVEATATAFGGASFASLSQSDPKTDDTKGATEKLSAGTTPAASKPAIDAEVARLSTAGAMRRDVMESLFWDLATLGKGLPSAGTAAAEDAKKLLALVKCAQDEITDPKGRRCGGEE